MCRLLQQSVMDVHLKNFGFSVNSHRSTTPSEYNKGKESDNFNSTESVKRCLSLMFEAHIPRIKHFQLWKMLCNSK